MIVVRVLLNGGSGHRPVSEKRKHPSKRIKLIKSKFVSVMSCPKGTHHLALVLLSRQQLPRFLALLTFLFSVCRELVGSRFRRTGFGG